mmetsp:Transcript_14905/g.42311  ORF Transcript_14905/g.42311 Transcript_14905/m.42311 type:complete len:519 (-) Transcript_14905:121-1677(-)|eukprot:CAMPEP_0170226792 /NCGR_PEP_ID=MMETSP0116_2-20130129/13108_1 /TAXON_ID=400756 /ORGANISM="Durinskia baltica, Strain CSIRO CS-38" /LENGTH=518 /DNA_ID=CAMNT_0010477519 /DNA_START=129 /DNA_END=1685 /DNA_ORIENTATION=+
MAINVEMPLHKARELMAPYRNAMPINNPLPEIDTEPPEPPNVLVDAVTLGGMSESKQKPLVRHVLVKDLNKIGARLKFDHPKTGVFTNKAPMGLYALFDGHSTAGESGPMAAEFCARNFHLKLLKRLSEVPADAPDEQSVQVALIGAFEDLDCDLIASQPEVNDGCGAAVVLLIGDVVFTAVVGQCVAILCDASNRPQLLPVSLGGRQGVLDTDVLRIRYAGGDLLGPVGDGDTVRIRHPSGAESSVSRSLGDKLWKGSHATGFKSQIVVCTPVVQHVHLKGYDDHPFLLLAASSVGAAMSLQELVDIADEYPQQPRAGCGEIVARALVARAGAAQCTALEVCFLPRRSQADNKRRPPGTAGPEGPPTYLAKKAKIATAPGGGTQSVRLRHILVKYQEASAKDGKKLSRTRQEAEMLLRRALCDIRADLRASKKTPKDAMELVGATSKKFMEICRRLSECDSARKGGAMCGDLGWLTPEDLSSSFGAPFKEVVDVLMPGQFSDIAVTEQGLHLVQRVA